MARTNVDVDDRLIAVIQHRYGVSTKREAIDLALRHLAGRPMLRDEIAALAGSDPTFAVPEDRGPAA